MKEVVRRAGYKDRMILMTAALTCAIALMCLSTSVMARTGTVHLTDHVKEVPARPALFDKEVEPLSMEKCAQCHTGVFTLLKEQGNRHQLPCTFCHSKYHTLAPGKVEYADAVPKCQTCHATPHGDDPATNTCSNCHSNAHSPLNIPDITSDMCVRCHQGPPQQLTTYQSKHSELDCTTCHTSHGYIPSCMDCHSEDGGEPFHLTGVKSDTCLSCHPVHNPLNITFSESEPQEYCAPCHKNPSHKRVLKEIREADSKHNTEVTCSSCHDKHGKIPSCFKCHEGHLPEQTVTDCLHCHANPHQPLNIIFNGEEPQNYCAPCHEEQYDALVASGTRHASKNCSFCHDEHGKVPECQKCHQAPHGESIHKRFENCAECHGSAHNVQGRMKTPQP
ncbi:MAG: hypothetical protein OEM02_03310 [Desulfobulbaceae bacterium]|nr:hypothetical protein [Desulfobulbaceae bacterium]